MALNIMIRIGYFLLFLTLGLMIWASLSTAKETDNMKFPPCPFNTLCSCSKAAPDLGIVQCRSVPFPAIPESINNSKVFMLHMESTGLRFIEPYFLYATGLYRLEVSYNPLTDIPDDAFAGLERTLWELMLQHNHLIDIPSRAFRHLQKLRHLDLSGNQISTIEPDSWRGLENSLQTLILSENSISHLPPDSFASLPLLETLDLSGNNLAEIDGSVFRDGMAKLSKLLLSDNLLIEIPFMELSPLKLLRTLDISYNRIQNLLINDMQNPQNSNVKMTLDNLHLEYNIIDILTPGSFQYFDIVNRTFFDGNPLKTISEDAFRQARIRELYLRHCTLNFISPTAFAGLENSLHILDLSGNNLTALPEKLFNDFDYLRNLNLRDNQITSIAPNEMFNGFQFTLFKLDLSGNKNGVSNLQELRRLRNIRSLAVGKLSSQNLVQDDFLEFGVELEDLKIVQASIKSIKSHAFMHVRGLKRLDLSENAISTIESDAFQEIGHSLISLKISHGLSSSLSKLPSEPLRHLSSLQELDITNNKIKTMVDTSFHFLKELRTLELHDNQIEQIHKGTFQGDIHSKLEEISLSFNNIKTIVQHTFVDLENLERLHLDDNNIDNLERRAFMNLDALNYLSLRGNKLSKITDETFQIEYNDQLPKQICEKCETMVLLFYENVTKCVALHQQWYKCAKLNVSSNSCYNIINGFHMRQQRIAKSFAKTDTSADLSENKYKKESILGNLFIDSKVNSLKELCQNTINKNSLISKFKQNAINTLEEINIDSITVKKDPKTAKRRNKRNKLFFKNVTKKKKRKLNDDTTSFNNETVELENVLKTGELVDSCIGEKENNNLNNFMVLKNNETPSPDKLDVKNKICKNFDISKIPDYSSPLSPFLKASPERNHDKNDQNNPNDNLELSQNELPNDSKYATNVKMECPNCGLICSDIKQLAIHQMSHLSVKLNCIKRVLILDPRFRRGVDYTIQGVNRMQCLNCLKRYSNANMLKRHWNRGKCDYYCKICSMDFSNDPNKLPIHVWTVHKIKYYRNLIRPPKLKNAFPKKQDDPKYSIKIVKCESLHSNTDLQMTKPKQKSKKTIRKRKIVSGKFSCEKCFCSFPNIYSKNSHMRLHKTIKTN